MDDKNKIFIEKARKIHGDKYDYKLINYINNRLKIKIICPIHGIFEQTPKDHLNGCGCPLCFSERRKQAKTNVKDFVKRANIIHNNKYDYSKVLYKGATSPITIICPLHGEFLQRPNNHLNGQGCPLCANKEKGAYRKNNTENFIKRATEKHNGKYDYSKVEYVNNHTKVCIICSEHGEFWQTPSKHLAGQGCKRCKRPNEGMTKEEFIKKARNVHGNKYDYSKVEYVNTVTPVTIICPEHGEFKQKPEYHLTGRGCTICNIGYTLSYKFDLLNEFVDEFRLRDFLMNNDENIIYIILRNIEKIEPKFNSIVKDIDRVLRSDSTNPIEDLEDKYRTPNETITPDETVTSDTVDGEINTTTIDDIDLDDDDAVEAFINKTNTKVEKKEPTIDELTKAKENEINLINTIEHMLTPEDLKFIKDKFLNDKRRNWMLERDKR